MIIYTGMFFWVFFYLYLAILVLRFRELALIHVCPQTPAKDVYDKDLA